MALPFPQQEEYDSLLLRSKELTALLSEDTESTARTKADIQAEKSHSIDVIFNGVPETVCEVRFFNFVKDNFDENSTIAAWSADSDEAAIQSLVNYGFSKDDISNTVLKFSPAVPSREEVYNMVEDCTRRSAACQNLLQVFFIFKLTSKKISFKICPIKLKKALKNLESSKYIPEPVLFFRFFDKA